MTVTARASVYTLHGLRICTTQSKDTKLLLMIFAKSFINICTKISICAVSGLLHGKNSILVFFCYTQLDTKKYSAV